MEVFIDIGKSVNRFMDIDKSFSIPFIDIGKWFIDINNWFIDIDKSVTDIDKLRPFYTNK